MAKEAVSRNPVCKSLNQQERQSNTGTSALFKGSIGWCEETRRIGIDHHYVGQGPRRVEEEVELRKSDGSQPERNITSKPSVFRAELLSAV